MGYMSFTDSIRANGDRHMANARRHAAEGNKEYAFGSAKKARRNYEKAAQIEAAFQIHPLLRPAYDATVAAITANLYRGA